jgi:hypothetical protein
MIHLTRSPWVSIVNSMIEQIANVRGSSACPSERTMLLGYMIGAPAGYLVALSIQFLWHGYSSTNSTTRDLTALQAMLMVPVIWIATAIPFIVVRKMSGPRCFASPGRAVISGLIIAFLDLPLITVASRPFDIEGTLPPFPQQIMEIIFSHSQFIASAGAISGLSYWMVEFASFPRIKGFLIDPRPLRGTGGWVSRRAGLAGAALLSLAACVEVIHWRWQPAIQQSSATPNVTFLREWRSKEGQTYFLTWSSDQRRLTSLGGTKLTVQNQAGATLSEIAVPGLNAWGVVADDRHIVAPASTSDPSGTAFTVIDLATGELAFREFDPVPGGPGLAHATVKLAMSADGSRLAVGYQPARANQPVMIYDTRTWRRVLTIDEAGDPVMGTSAIALSSDGARVAFGKRFDLIIADSQTGAAILKIPGRPEVLAFNTAGDQIVAEMTAFTPARTVVSTLKVYRVADGTEVASHGPAAHLVWDPKGRFIAFTTDWNQIGLWNHNLPAAPDTMIEVPPPTGPVAISRDGGCLAAVTGDAISFFRIGDDPERAQRPSVCNEQ